jgi:membrane-bound lytic murein transglycosylase D
MRKTELVCRRVVFCILTTLFISTISQNLALGQSLQPQTDNIKALMERAEASFKKGEAAFHKGQKEEARRYFDESVEVIMVSGVNLRANPRLDAFYVELVERINGFDVPKAIRSDSIPVVNNNTNSYRQQQDVQPAVNVERSLIDDISNINENELSAVSSSGVRIYGKYDFDFSVAPPVLQYLNYFVSGRGRSTMETGLQRSGRYRQMAEKIFKEEGVPTDLIWLAQAESVWKPNALSHAAAKGIWQFIPGTGTRFGLMQTAYVDERSHPEKSTRAAAKYLKWLHTHFAGDWMLAMAAYNSGENRIDNAIARCGYADFWELYRQGLIPRETQNYVPIILAITIVSKNQKRYGFNVKPDPTIHYDTTDIPDQTDIRVVADLLGVPYEVIQDLNPELRRGSTPPGQAYALRLPKGMKKSFEVAFAELPEEQRLRSSRTLIARDDTPERAKPERLERIERADRDEKSSVRNAEQLLTSRSEKPSVRVDTTLSRTEKPSVRLDQTLARAEKSSFKTQIISYQVKRGDTLASVARQHGVSTQEVAKLNRLSSRGELLKGQSIRVPANVQAPNLAKASNSKSRTYESRYATKNILRMELKGRGKAKLELRSKTSSKSKAKPAATKSKSSKRRR